MLTACKEDKEVADKTESIITFSPESNTFPLVTAEGAIPICISSEDFSGVIRVAEDFQKDIEKVTGKQPVIFTDTVPAGNSGLIIGTIGRNELIDNLISEGKIDTTGFAGKWEAYTITTITGEINGLSEAIIIAGADMRGTIFGTYELSSQIGVSPWYWWADVPVKQHTELYLRNGEYIDFPEVKYRGIFLNDEFPALGGWANENYGGFNHEFYVHVFELILRLKGNFLWPAMWGSAFYDDDTLNPKLAHEYGVVIGTSHHEPLMRAHAEWAKYGEGPWNYEVNKENLQKFWSESIRERKDYEALITVGMRGDGDEAMTEGTAIALLERIIEDQRIILEKEMGIPMDEIPQVWAIYKEVQDYYDKGMDVPEDITLLLCDDNWGNVRRLPEPGEEKREGGYGMYYHFDFVGGPVSYRWLNVSPNARTWEQMNMCYEHGVDHIWIVNVGDLKPMEYPISFFLEHAWDPDNMTAGQLPVFATTWAEEQFGPEHAEEIAYMLTQYTRFNYRRTPEMLKHETYSMHHYREAENVVKEYNELLDKARMIGEKLPAEYADAYYQLVTHQIEACANLNEMYYTTARNHLYAEQKRATTNRMADRVEELFNRDAEITDYYHTELADGKWNHFMSQTHIGYTSWNNPDKNYMPEVFRIDVPDEASLGVMLEGTKLWYPDTTGGLALPVFDNFNRQNYYIELFNRGSKAINYKVSAEDPWVVLSGSEGKMVNEERLWVEIDWKKLGEGENNSLIHIEGDEDSKVAVSVTAFKHTQPEKGKFTGHIEANGYISIEAEHFADKLESETMHWQVIPGFGRTLSGVTVMPTTHPSVEPGNSGPNLEYPVYLHSSGEVAVSVYIAPSLNIYANEGMKYATSFDDDDPQVYKIHEFDTIPDWFYPAWWNNSVTDNIRIHTTKHMISEPGEHVLKLWMVTPGVVFEKIVIETEEIGDSYLGPPESYYMKP